MNKNYYAVIMAGGVGTRFWPMSTKKNPKQFHDMLGTGDSLIQKTFSRLENIIPSNNILISTNNNYEALVLKQLPKVSKQQLVLEPCMRNTSPCILYAALKIYEQNPDALMIVAPSDHWIEDEKTFSESILKSFDFCSKQDALMTLGIQPNNPNTGYGYIKFESSENQIKKVENFTEKPCEEKAKQFIESGDYLWNAGIFVWSAKSIINSFRENLPEMVNLFENGKSVLNTDAEKDFILKNYSKSENISIDFGILEKANNVYTLPVSFGWNDLGTWGSLYDKSPKDSAENVSINGDIIFKDSSNNIVRTQKKKKVIIQGLDNYIVVEKDNVLLICPKDQEQKIKEITAIAEEKFGSESI